MHGDLKVIEQLNMALRAELTAIVQYMTQSEMCQNWGYTSLGEQHRSVRSKKCVTRRTH